MAGELNKLRARLAEADATLGAIRRGEVDAVVVAGPAGPRVFTLDGAEHAYRLLIESMNEGALTLTTDAVILYANQCFARMVQSPLERVIGGSFRRFLSAEDRTTLRPLLKHRHESGSKVSIVLKAQDGSLMPVRISLRFQTSADSDRGTIAIVVTDMTEARRSEDLMRALTRRVVQGQEDERGRLAAELHDHITQLLCAVVFRSQALVDGLPARCGPSKQEAIKLREMLRRTAEEVERISRNLRPSVLTHLGLAAVLQQFSKEFAQRTGVLVKLTCAPLQARLPPEVELTLYRILQQALAHVETHAHARHVVIRLSLQRASVRLTISGDGIGFDPDNHGAGIRKDGLGLLGMRERAAYAGGVLAVTLDRHAGTRIEVDLPR